MRLVSWNVNGLRAVLGKDFASIFDALGADVFSLQETKLQPDQYTFYPEGYEVFLNSAQKKGYSGTATLTRRRPLSVRSGIGIPEHDTEGRVLTLEYPDFYLVNCYTPNSQDGLRRLDYRLAWERDFSAYLQELDRSRGVVLCGDLNVAHEEIDIRNPKTNHFNPGFSDQERQAMTDLLEKGFCDTFRILHPDTVKYSWWSYRMQAREKNVGWRIDYFLVSSRLMPRVRRAEILTDVYGSDHCPVLLELEEEPA
ncbi:MAG: exodeoxyribonuclease III [Clostridia bacterium]|nr:exodeoxyribonuclease III [Clostridia bacterium]